MNPIEDRLPAEYFRKDALDLAPEFLGLQLVRRFDNGEELVLDLTEVEIYRGEEDLGCHASKGRTQRTDMLYHEGGKVYVYLIYGMYWLLNIVTGPADHPQALLIRGSRQIYGPGRIGRLLQLDKSFNGENVGCSERLWLRENPAFQILTPYVVPATPTGTPGIIHTTLGEIITAPRIGIDYAGPNWSKIPWRFTLHYTP